MSSSAPARNAASGPRDDRRRFFSVAVFFAALAALIVVKLITLQVVSPDRLLRLGSNQRTRAEALLGHRGTISDRNGVDLALSVSLRTVVADPALITDKAAAADIVTEVLKDVDRDQLLDRLNEPNSRYAYVSRQIEPMVAKNLLRWLERAEIKGFFTEDEQLRVQTSTDVAAAILGDVDIDGNGTWGVEELLDSQLKGETGRKLVERAQDGSTIANSERVVTPASAGSDVGLTIDRDMQFDVERALIDGVESTSAAAGIAIVGKPETGEILAVANVRRDPKTGEVTTSNYNMAFAQAIEPGSVLKMVTASAAFNEGVVTPTEVLSIPGSIRVADHTYRDHDPRPDKAMRVDDIIAESSNVGTITLARRLTPALQEQYLRKFGFGSKSPINFPRESAGILRAADKWAPTDAASIAIGQGIATTPLQLWSAYNVIANGGEYVDPRIVNTVDQPGKAPIVLPASKRTTVLQPEVALWVNRALRQVVSSGTASKLDIPGYSLAGKTGTAYKPNPETHTYEWPTGRKYTATFAGFLPASAPEVTIAIVIDEPTGAHTGASAAAPVFEDVAEIAIRRMSIPQDQAILTATGAAEAERGDPVRATPAVAQPRTADKDSVGAESGKADTASKADAAAADEESDTASAADETAANDESTDTTQGATGDGSQNEADDGSAVETDSATQAGASPTSERGAASNAEQASSALSGQLTQTTVRTSDLWLAVGWNSSEVARA